MMDDIQQSNNGTSQYIISEALTGEMPNFPSNTKESKFQALMNNRPHPSSSTNVNYQNIPQYPTITSKTAKYSTDLSVEAKAFQPVKGQPPMSNLNFNSLTLSEADNNHMSHMQNSLHPNPSAREFIPRPTPSINTQPPSNLKQQPPHLNGSFNSDFAQPKPMRATDSLQQASPFYPPPNNQFPSLPSIANRSDASLTPSTSVRNHAQLQPEFLPDINGMMLQTSGYQTQSNNSNHYYTEGSTQSNHMNGGFNNSTPVNYPRQQQQQQRLPIFNDSYTSAIERSSPASLLNRRTVGSTVSNSILSNAANSSQISTTPNVSMVSSNSHHEQLGMNKQVAPDDRNKPVIHQNGGTTYFYSDKMNSSRNMRSVVPNVCQQYPGTPAHIEYSLKNSNNSYFMSNELRKEFHRRQNLSLLKPEIDNDLGLPERVEGYCDLLPHDSTLQQAGNAMQNKLFVYNTYCYKAFKEKDGKAYFIRRVQGFRQVNDKSMVYVEIWKKLQHANLVQLREVFTTKAFGELSLIFVHDYHAGTESLSQRHFRPSYSQTKFGSKLIPETLIWSYVIQLTNAIRSIHAVSLACRVIDPSKILVIDKSRIRISGVGILDVLMYDMNPSSNQIQQHQQEDLVALGKLILSLAMNSNTLTINSQTVQKYLEIISNNYSSDLKNLVSFLIMPGRPMSVNDVMPLIGARFYIELENSMTCCDIMESELEKELQNGRLYRLISKFATINERPEFDGDTKWSETGDRYLIKLFRDYVFHAVRENGEPFVDLAHITSCLNKLDAGSSENVCLMSRDEQNVLVVSYMELKKAFTKCFAELTQTSMVSVQR